MEDAEIKLLVKEKADTARNQAIGILSLIVIVVTLLTSLGIYGLAVNYIDESIKTAIEDEGIKAILTRIKKTNSEAENIINSLRKKNKAIEAYAKGAELVLEKHKNSGWLSKAPIPQTFKCPEGYIITGIDFTHKVYENLTYQESYRVHYAKLKIKAK
jgi:hypothetical protein